MSKETGKAVPATGNISFNTADGPNAARGERRGDLIRAQRGRGGPGTERAAAAPSQGVLTAKIASESQMQKDGAMPVSVLKQGPPSNHFNSAVSWMIETHHSKPVLLIL